MIRFLQNWLAATIVLTPVLGVVTSWNSTTLTLPLAAGIVAAFTVAATLEVNRK